PAFNGKSWIVNAKSAAGAPQWQIDGWLVCASTAAFSGYQVATQETTVDASSMKAIEVGCPSGTFLAGGGFADLDATGAILEGRAMYYAPLSVFTWQAAVSNESAFSPNYKVRARAICIKP